MACPNCGKTANITIGNKQYCASCGTALPTEGSEAPTQVAAPTPAESPEAPLAASPPVAASSPKPPAAPGLRRMTDIRPASGVAPAAPPHKPSLLEKLFHKHEASSNDQSQPATTPAAPTVPASPIAPPSVATAPTQAAPATPAPAASLPVAAPAPPAAPLPPPPPIAPSAAPAAPKPVSTFTSLKPADQFHSRVQPAGTNPTPVNVTTSVASPTAPAVSKLKLSRARDREAAAAASQQSGSIQKFKRAPAISSAASPSMPPPAATAPQPETMPNAVASQIASMNKLLPEEAPKPALPAAPPEPALPAPNRTKPATVAAVVIAIAVMGGVIWSQNYPKLALKTAADKAGIAAALPGYVPSSYSLNGPIAYSSGQVTLTYTSPSQEQPLTISQHQSDWDAGALLDNFVAQQTGNYQAVQGQGLTIYLYNNDQATWVNHGIWYQISGTGHLSREQVLKLAYSL